MGVEVAGLGVAHQAGPAHAVERDRRVVDVQRCSQSFLPVPASKQATISWREIPSPTRPLAQTRPSKTTGVERPTKSWRQTRFSPSVDQLDTSPVSGEVPLRAGPRQWLQPAASQPGGAPRAATATAASAAATAAASGQPPGVRRARRLRAAPGDGVLGRSGARCEISWFIDSPSPGGPAGGSPPRPLPATGRRGRRAPPILARRKLARSRRFGAPSTHQTGHNRGAPASLPGAHPG